MAHYPSYMVQCEDTPDGFITISDEGCGTSLELDTKTGCLYLAGCGEEMLAEDPSQPSSYLITLEYVGASLEEWLEHWLGDTLYDGEYPKSVGYLTPDMVSTICESDSQLVWRGVYQFGMEAGDDERYDDDDQSQYGEDSPEYEVW
jgi:hypothetical protein